MNLQAITAPYVAAVNPFETITIAPSAGYTTGPDGKRTPTYGTPVLVEAQIQALQYNDIAQLDGLNIQGVRCAMYLQGDWEGLIRADQKGGDLITRADNTKWLVVLVLERWTGWVKVAATLQNNA